MKKKLISMLLAVSMTVAMLSACSSNAGGGDSGAGASAETADTGSAEQTGDAETPAPVATGGTYTLGMSVDCSTGAAWRIRSGQEKACWSAVYEPLMRFDANGNLVGFLAESLTADEDALTYTVKLREGITFSDGSVLDADVLLWNFENFKENSQTSATHFGDVDSFEKTDDLTVVIHLSQWNTQIPYSLNSVAGLMYSKQAFDENGYEWAEEHPVGTGPYVCDEWVRDDHKTFSKNENYWNADAVVPFDTFETRVIADEMSAQAALISGDIQGYYGGSEQFQDTMEKAGYSRNAGTMWYRILFLIFASDVDGSPLTDVKVRQAISYAIDSDTIASTIGYNKAFVSKEYAVEGTPFYNPAVQGYSYDPDQAKALLEEAGYADGFTTTIYCGVDQALTDYLVAIQGYLKEVGITLNIEEQETAIWTSKGIYDIDEGMILAGHGFGANLVNQQASNFSKRAIEGVGMLKEVKIHPDDLDESIMNSLRASSTEEMLQYEFETQRLIIDEYCLGYPVVMIATTVVMLDDSIVDGGCYESDEEFMDYTKLYPAQ